MKNKRVPLWGIGLVVFFIHLFSFPARSAPLSPDRVPEPLKPWVDWVLRGHETELCPFFSDQEDQRPCVWPSSLSLDLEEKGGKFTQKGLVYLDSWFPLPGDEDHWPQDVKMDGQPASVLDHEGKPSVFLKKGEHNFSGAFQWDSLPESLPVPVETGLLSLTLSGQKIDFPNRDAEGRLWLEKTSSKQGTAEDRLEIRVHRKLVDEIPFQVVTQLLLNVSGKNRELKIGKVIGDGFIPMEVKSPLPLRLEKDGSVKIQVRAGNWTLEFTHRHEGPAASVEALPTQENWPEEEIWVFDARNHLRLVTVEGVPSIDPQQTTLPQEWKNLPAYRLKPGEALTLVEKRRGDSDPSPDQLNLVRQMWLDFNGKGYTLQDRITGTLNRGSRLEMNPSVRLGRVSVSGQDQLITTLKKDGGAAGVEIPPGSVDLSADSRVEGRGSLATAVGWNHGFQQVSGTLHLPPGWRIFSASGVDEVPQTWINRWTLLDFFLVFITALAFAKLWGKKWGLLALIMLVLTFPEQEAPQWAWLAVILGCALLRVIPPGKKWRGLIRFYRWGAVVALLLFSVPFMVQQLRQGLYPALEHPEQVMEASVAGVELPAAGEAAKEEKTVQRPEAAPAPQGFAGKGAPRQMMEEAEAPPPSQMIPSKAPLTKKKVYEDRSLSQLLQVQTGAKVQTGPGLPRWRWNQIDLKWNGPVDQGQKVRLRLISPFFNLLLAFLRVGLLALLALCVMEFPGSFWPWWLKGGMAAAVLFLGFSSLFLIREARADFPSTELLNELRTGLLENPECHPSCAALSQMELEVSGNRLTARLTANAEAMTALPLPGSATEWMPEHVVIDGKGEPGLLRSEEGHLWMQISPGVHQILLEGPLPPRETVQIALPLKPYHVRATLQGWSLGGLHEDGQADDVLQLTRLQASQAADNAGLTSENLPAFVQVERRLNLGLTWEVETNVSRLTPSGTAVVLEIPLLEGESVTTADVRVEKGNVILNMAPNTTEVSWNSVMEPKEGLVLKAPQNSSWTEVWDLSPSPLWHVESEGIPPVHPEEDASVKEWRPWPGEELHLKIVRPQAVEGPTLTIDQSLLSVTPGLRMSEMNLQLTLRSSLGGQHVLKLPEKAELQSVSINGTVQPIRQDQNQVTLPIVPGSQNIELKWLQPSPIAPIYKVPPVNLSLASVNSEIQMNLGQSRWILFACGPRMGPAVLIWSLIIVLLLIAWGLGRINWIPMKTFHWALLGLGLSQVPIEAAAVVVGWFLVMGWRKRSIPKNILWFDLRQLILVFWTLVAVGILFDAIHQGLLGIPDMEIAGNGSSYSFLRWYQDRSGEILPRPWVLSLPLFAYRSVMFFWALWIALALIRWIKWAWSCLGESGFWRSLRVRKVDSVGPAKPDPR
jgi:hypothetical protein